MSEAFENWALLRGENICPAQPRHVAQFVKDCAGLGAERLLAELAEISRAHIDAGHADPCYHPFVDAALDRIAPVTPPRSWSAEFKFVFRSLPHSVRAYIAKRENDRDKALRKAQNKLAIQIKETRHGTPPTTHTAA